MIHRHVTMRDLLRNPKDSFPKTTDQQVIVSKAGFPSYAINMLSVSATLPLDQTFSSDTKLDVVKDGTGNISIHKHEEK